MPFRTSLQRGRLQRREWRDDIHDDGEHDRDDHEFGWRHIDGDFDHDGWRVYDGVHHVG
jgi:hypothetical protein